jgi:phosphatidylserine/phosphatidylglycerophosphate/cardiolipin synthase-like enzyme
VSQRHASRCVFFPECAKGGERKSEPADGVEPLLTAIKSAKKSVEIAVFRFDRTDIETALKAAAKRGVKVTALIAFANRGANKACASSSCAASLPESLLLARLTT